VFGNWIIGTNLRPLAEMLSWCVKRDFEESDWNAIALALDGTDEASGRWGTYDCAGWMGQSRFGSPGPIATTKARL
jgi:hypothetical protein